MKNLKLKTLAIIIGGLIAANVLAQDADKVKAMVSDLPSEMAAGSSVQITVTITNTGGSTWSSDKLSAKETGPFDITKVGSNEFTLEPGQSQTLNYTLTAPKTTGKKKCKVYFYTSGKKIGSKSKTITVI